MANAKGKWYFRDMQDRLLLTEDRTVGIAEGVRQGGRSSGPNRSSSSWLHESGRSQNHSKRVLRVLMLRFEKAVPNVSPMLFALV